MSLITAREAVLEIHEQAAFNKWVIPTICAENLTTIEAILSAVLQHSKEINRPNLPITIAITNQYSHRGQSINYTHTRRWDIGLRLFLKELEILTGEESPFKKLNVMVHLDHTQWDTDEALLQWDMNQFSSIMYDASNLPFDKNIKKTAQFIEKNGSKIVIEGACDEIVDATANEATSLTTPEKAVEYRTRTNADYIVANLGTEHRANTANLEYRSDLAKLISKQIGPRLVLHGASSVPSTQIKNLFNDGIAKVNIWTRLERDSSPVLFEEMLVNASKIIGKGKVDHLIKMGLLGGSVDMSSEKSISHFTTTYRQNIIFSKMKEIVLEYLRLWYN